MNRNLIKERHKHVLFLRDEFQNYIFNERQRMKQDTLEEIIAKNTMLVRLWHKPDATSSFMYKGSLYKAWHCRETRGLNRIIHADMLAEIKTTLDFEEFEALIEEQSIMNYIGNALITAKHTFDLLNLIPAKINQPLDVVNEEIFNIGPQMTEQEINSFKEANSAGLHSFKRLFLTRLLLD